MPNWDRDEDDWEEDINHAIGRTVPKRRASIIRGPQHREQPTWNGNPVAGMEDDHVMNAILFCEKRFAEASANYNACFPNADAHADGFYFKSVYDMFPDYRHLRDEWFRRNKQTR